jgi:hypothetical protein
MEKQTKGKTRKIAAWVINWIGGCVGYYERHHETDAHAEELVTNFAKWGLD